MTERIKPTAPIRAPIVATEPAGIERSIEAPLPRTDFNALRLELARRQLRLIDAQKYVQQALSISPLIETDVHLEEGCAAVLRAVSRSQPVADASLAALIERGLPQLIDVLDAQRESFGLPADHPIFDRIAAIAFAHLRDRPKTDRKAAMQSILAAGNTMGLGFSTTALYLNFHFDYERANGFTNEGGLPDLIRTLDTTGGAVVGVGGAVFDIGSTGSDMIISVDASSLIADCIHTFTGILLAVDELVEKNGWDDVRRAEEVQLRLTRGSHPDTIAELERLGLPGQLRDSLPQILDALAKKLAGDSREAKPIPQDLWCRSAGPARAKPSHPSPLAPLAARFVCSDRQAERILHLTRLALDGRIVALTADLADPRIGERVNALLRAHGSTAKVIHFSNALDYVADIRGACRTFGAIDLHPDAVLTTTCSWIFRDPVNAAEPDGYTILGQLGVNEKPAKNRASEWLGKDKLGDVLHQVAWDSPGHVRDLVAWAANLLMLKGEYPTPANIEQYRELLDRMITDAFADPEDARDKLIQRMKNLGRLDAYEMVDKAPLTGLSFPLPKSFADLVPIADQIDAQFWSRGDRRERFLQMALDRREVSTDLPADRIAACRTYDDLRDLELHLLDQARLAHAGEGSGQHEAERA